MTDVFQQIDALSTAEKIRIMKHLIYALEDTVAVSPFGSSALPVDITKNPHAVFPSKPKRSLEPDPELRCEIKCDLFEDDSSEWESA